jgi:transposase
MRSFYTYKGASSDELFVTLLRKMMWRRTKPMQLVVDGLPAHTTVLAKECVAPTNGMLTLHYPPGYATELNPDKFVWSHMKSTGVARSPLRRGETMQDKIEAQIAAIKRTPQLDRSSFSEPLVK